MVSSVLPTISASVTIDGTSESTLAGQGAVVQINGGGGAFDGLILGTGSVGSKIAGLDIVNFGGAGIRVESSGDLISDNLLGTDPTGKSAGPGNAIGIFIDGANGGGAATIGRKAASAGNTIGFNAVAGISISGAAATGNLIAGNFIGSDSDGDRLTNGIGISVGASSNTIGGTTSAAANVISLNSGAGILIDANSELVVGNFIGTNAIGNKTTLGNAVGVSITGLSNTVGGTASGAANTIGFSTQQGVSVLSGIGNVISGNLYDGTNGPALPVQANDISLASGANSNLVAPTLESAALTGTTLTLEVYETTVTSNSPTIEIYLDTPGQRSIQISQSMSLSSDPNNPTLITVPNTNLTLGDLLVATVTDQTDGTSAFSASTFIANPYVVINTDDGGSGSLRAAIGNANRNAGQTISFAIPASLATSPTSDIFAILLSSALPTISVTTTIDGTTDSTLGGPAAVVQINGGGGNFDGLILSASGDTITGLDIVNFLGAGIHIESKNETITDNLLGTDATGSTAGPGNQVGIFIDGGSDNTIGGTTSGVTNTIGFNTLAGISISGRAATGNLILGNFIGTNSTGGNLGNPIGISISSADNTIGGTAGVGGNTIGFNTSAGVSISGAGGTGNDIIGNFIGTNKLGGSLANVIGVSLSASGNTIGGTSLAAANVIGFNTGSGISITASGDFVLGDFIGTDSALDDLGNVLGISISGSTNTVGETGAANTIGFNAKQGVLVLSGNGNAISQNLYLGTNGAANDISVTGGANDDLLPPTLVSAAYDIATSELLLEAAVNSTSPVQRTIEIYLDTTDQRVFLISTSMSLTNIPTSVPVIVPGLASGELIIATVTDSTNSTSAFSAATAIVGPNVVTNTNDSGAGALRSAISFANTTPGTTIVFAIAGTSPFVIAVKSVALPEIKKSTTIDGTTESTFLGQPAVVEINGDGNSYDGLTLGAMSDGSTIDGLEIIEFGDSGIHVESSGDTIFGNLIGTDGSPTEKAAGNTVGVFVDGANGGTGATIGGTSAGAGNTIGLNFSAGVSIAGTAATSDLLAGNYIGTDPGGDDLANAVGVAVASDGNTIGGTSSGFANIIGFNSISGISISGADNLVVGNLIGTNSGGANLSNPLGILISGSYNMIGGTTASSANVIDFNSSTGVSISAARNVVAGNDIGTNPAGANLGNPIGISVSASNNTIGGPTLGAGNTIGFNATGISLDASTVLVEGNYIGTNSVGANLGNPTRNLRQ